MPEYEVISSSDDVIVICSLLCWDEEESRLVVIKVKDMTGEGGEILVGEKINISTSNKEIIPEDIAVMSRVIE